MGHQKKDRTAEAEGPSRGGLTTKIHSATDALGCPLRFIITEGQSSEHKQAEALISGLKADYVLADKGYDSNQFIESIESSGAEPVIPPKKNRTNPQSYDATIYKERNFVERLFQKMKRYRRIATGYERLARNDRSMLCLVGSMIWLE